MKIFMKLNQVLVLNCILLFFPSCFSYKQVPIPKQEIKIEDQFIILHQKQKQWFIYDAFVNNDTISGTICSTIDQSLKPRFIHVYLLGDFKVPTIEKTNIYIPFDSINSIEVNARDNKQSFIYTVGAIGSYMFIGGLIILIFN